MKKLISLALALTMASSASAQRWEAVVDPRTRDVTPVFGTIGISFTLDSVRAWLNSIFSVQQVQGKAIDSVMHGVTELIKPNHIMDSINVQHILQQTVSHVLPNMDISKITTFSDLEKVQNTVIPEIGKIADKFYAELMEKSGQDLTSLRESGRIEMPSFQKSILAIAKPKLMNQGEVLTKVNQVLAEQSIPPLNLNKAALHVEVMTELYRKIHKAEYELFEPYMANHVRMNGDIARANLKSVSGSMNRLQTAQLEKQTVSPHGPALPITSPNVIPSPREPSLLAIDAKLRAIEPHSPQANEAKSAGLASVQAADQAFARQDAEAGKFYKEVAVGLADIALGFVPVVGVGRDIFEAVTGKSLLTGRSLSVEERALAIVGVATVGLASSGVRAIGYISKIARNSDHVARAGAQATRIAGAISNAGLKAAEAVPVLRRYVKAHSGADSAAVLNNLKGEILDRADALGLKLEKRRIKFADDINEKEAAPGFTYGHLPETLAVSGIVTSESNDFRRVYSSQLDNWERSYIVHKSTIEGLSAVEISKRVNITYVPDRIADVKVLTGTSVSISEIAATRVGNEFGHIQIYVAPEDLKSQLIFSNFREIPTP